MLDGEEINWQQLHDVIKENDYELSKLIAFPCSLEMVLEEKE